MEKEKVEELIAVDTAQLENYLSEVFKDISESFHFSAAQNVTFSKSSVARFIAALPFAAGCIDAQKKSVSHLSIYLAKILASENLGDYNADAVSTVYEDLGILSMFDGGDETVVQHGMYILALIMLEGYKDRSFSDMEQGIENPLNNDTWDYYTLKGSLLDDIKEHPCPELDALILTETGLLRNHF